MVGLRRNNRRKTLQLFFALSVGSDGEVKAEARMALLTW